MKWFLSHVMPLATFYTLKNVTKPKVSWYFQGVQKATSGVKWFKIATQKDKVHLKLH